MKADRKKEKIGKRRNLPRKMDKLLIVIILQHLQKSNFHLLFSLNLEFTLPGRFEVVSILLHIV
jgi:hypothetical protein